MPTAITDDATSFPAVTSPAGAEAPTAASLQTSVQQLANRTAYLKSNAMPGMIYEGFESVTFPPATPAGAWSAPSVRFGSDFAFQRDTSNPILGTASANRNATPGGASQHSMGLTIYLAGPSRISFLFDILCNNATDGFTFYIDGAAAMIEDGTSNTIAATGRFMSDVLREGNHTFDWRFTRAGSPVANEKIRIDAVNIIPESEWESDFTNRVTYFDDMFWSAGALTGSPWLLTNSGNAGSSGVGSLVASKASGSLLVTCAAATAADWEAITLHGASASFGAGAGAFYPYFEASLLLSASTQVVVEVGLWDKTLNNYAAIYYDTTAAVVYGVRTVSGGVATAAGINSVPASITTGFNRFAIMGSPTGWTGKINGATLSGLTNSCNSISNLPATATLWPYIRVGARTGANARSVEIDWVTFLGFRNTGYTG